MEARNPRCSVNQAREMALSDSVDDVLMESFCILINETEHSMEQPFKNGLKMGPTSKAFDDGEVCVIYYYCREIQRT
jgi:hypothetical protein